MSLVVWETMGRFHRPVDAVRLQFGVDGLGEAGLGKTNRLGAFDSEKFLQVRRRKMLHHRVIFEVQQDFRAVLSAMSSVISTKCSLPLLWRNFSRPMSKIPARRTNGNNRSTDLAGVGSFIAGSFLRGSLWPALPVFGNLPAGSAGAPRFRAHAALTFTLCPLIWVRLSLARMALA
jgi:hypothetical protein